MKKVLLSMLSLAFASVMFAQTATIYEIQGQGPTSPLADAEGVTTSGIVTAVTISSTTSTQSGYYIQDGVGAWNGIYVYDNTNIVTRGDNVTLTGTVTEYVGAGYTNSLTQLKTITSHVINSSGNTLPAAAEVSTLNANMEDYESVLIKVINANCTEWGTVAKTGTVSDGSGDLVVYDKFNVAFSLTVGTAYDITGVVGIYHDIMELFPRDANDIAIHSGVNSIANANFTIYPNPVSNLLNVNSQNASQIVVSNTIGQQVIRIENAKANEQISVADLQAGMYFVSVTDQNGNVSVKKLIKK